MARMDYFTPEQLHNEIAMDNSGSLIHLIVEGSTDSILFDTFVDESLCQIYYTRTKDLVLDLMTNLEAEGKNKYAVAVVDNDQDRLFHVKRPARTFDTDTNDIETMILFSDAFYRIATNLFPENDTKDKRAINAIRHNIIKWALPMGEFRVASKKNDWKLSFKEYFPHKDSLNPKSREKVKDFVMSNVYNNKNMQYVGDVKFLNYLRNHTCVKVPMNADAEKAIKEVRGAGYGPEAVIIGHDVSRIIAMAMMHFYHRKDLKGTTDKQVEAAFRLAYHKEFFVKTALYAELAKVRDEVQIAFI